MRFQPQFLPLIALPILGVLAGAFHIVSASWWAAGLLGFGLSLLCLNCENRVLRPAFFGKFGTSIRTWWFAHLVLQTVVFAVLTAVTSWVFGVHMVSFGWSVFFLIATWFLVCRETISILAAMSLMPRP